MSDGLKYDDGKVRLELVPPSLVLAVGEVLTFGAKKYEANRWRGVSAERYKGALLRHLMAYMDGEINDAESGLPHLWHVACNVAFLIELDGNCKCGEEKKVVCKTEDVDPGVSCSPVCRTCKYHDFGWDIEPCESCKMYAPSNYEEREQHA